MHWDDQECFGGNKCIRHLLKFRCPRCVAGVRRGRDQQRAWITTEERTAHLLLKLKNRLIGIPSRRPHERNRSSILCAEILSLHRIIERRFVIDRRFRFMNRYLGSHRGASAVSMRLTWNPSAALNAVVGRWGYGGESRMSSLCTFFNEDVNVGPASTA